VKKRKNRIKKIAERKGKGKLHLNPFLKIRRIKLSRDAGKRKWKAGKERKRKGKESGKEREGERGERN
jgi:hypothetical protein